MEQREPELRRTGPPHAEVARVRAVVCATVDARKRRSTALGKLCSSAIMGQRCPLEYSTKSAQRQLAAGDVDG